MNKKSYMDGLKNIAIHYGRKNQVEKAMEECLELWGALHDYIKNGQTEEQKTHVYEELADVAVLSEQLVFLLDNSEIYGAKKVEYIKSQKVQRQLDRIKKGE